MGCWFGLDLVCVDVVGCLIRALRMGFVILIKFLGFGFSLGVLCCRFVCLNCGCLFDLGFDVRVVVVGDEFVMFVVDVGFGLAVSGVWILFI